jgi:pimeloyl-ACP methyl ester carboxylesterase
VSLARRRRWLTAGVVILVAIAVGAALIWSSVRPPLVNVGGSLVEARVLGNGKPTVIFELGATGGHLAYWQLQRAASKHANTVAYERAGLGRSSQRPEPRSAVQSATELHALLETLNLPPPYVLVGHSYGALLIRVFAHRYPTEIAGLVFVDPATEGYFEYMAKETPTEWAAAANALSDGFRQQWLGIPAALVDARRAWPLPTVPVTILTAGQSLGQWPLESDMDMERFHQEQLALADRFVGSKLVPMPDADHMSILRKDQLVEEIAAMVKQVRVSR